MQQKVTIKKLSEKEKQGGGWGVTMQYQKGSWSRLALHLSGIAGKQTEKVHQDVTLLILIHSQLAKVNWPNCTSAGSYTCKTKLRKGEVGV